MSSSTVDLEDSFRILSLPITATEAEIKKAYRKLSLRFHPDKAGKDVDPVVAASRFHQINLAYETLMDPAARARAIQRNAEDSAKRERQQQYEGKRRQMADELERSEREALSKRNDAVKAARERQEKIAELQKESRRLVKRKQDEMDAKAKQKQEAVEGKRKKDEEVAKAEMEPELEPLDKTVRIVFPSSQLDQLMGKSQDSPLDTPLAGALGNEFGQLEHLQFQLPAAGKKMKRELLALATFKTVQDAWQAVVTGGEMRCVGLLEECFIGWANYSRVGEGREKVYVEPKRVKWWRERGIARPSDVGRVRPSLKADTEEKTTENVEEREASRATRLGAGVYSKAYQAKTLQRLRDAAKQSTLHEPNLQAQLQAAQ